MADLQSIEQAARESGDWRAAFDQVKAEFERLRTDLVGAREFHAAAGETVARMVEDNERLRTAGRKLLASMTEDYELPSQAVAEAVAAFGSGVAHPPSAANPHRLSASDVIARMCRLTEDVHDQLGYGHASDCFCRQGGFWGSGDYDGTPERGYRNDGHCLAFIEQAVRLQLGRLRIETPAPTVSPQGAMALVRDMLADKDAEIARLRALLNTPETADFLEGVKLEAAHQRERWGAPHDREKSAEHWYWLVGYLGGKALRSAIAGDKEKAQHHTISSAAALSHWHAAISQDTTGSGLGRDADLEAHDNGQHSLEQNDG